MESEAVARPVFLEGSNRCVADIASEVIAANCGRVASAHRHLLRRDLGKCVLCTASGSVNMLSTVPSGSGIDCATTFIAGYSSPLSQCGPGDAFGLEMPVPAGQVPTMTPWTLERSQMPVCDEAAGLIFGVILAGIGALWLVIAPDALDAVLECLAQRTLARLRDLRTRASSHACELAESAPKRRSGLLGGRQRLATPSPRISMSADARVPDNRPSHQHGEHGIKQG